MLKVMSFGHAVGPVREILDISNTKYPSSGLRNRCSLSQVTIEQIAYVKLHI